MTYQSIGSAADGSILLLDYWKMFAPKIAKERGWQCQRSGCRNGCWNSCGMSKKADAANINGQDFRACMDNCRFCCWRTCSDAELRWENTATLQAYDSYIAWLSDWLKKPIAEVSISDIEFAICQGQDYRESCGLERYSDSTVKTVWSIMRGIFEYAHSQGAANNILKYLYRVKGGEELIRALAKNSGFKREKLAALQEKNRDKVRSLTVRQVENLTDILRATIHHDGRVCAIAIMLYAGLRPAECRALCWRDITPFLDDSSRHLINVHRTRDGKAMLQNRAKTRNAYRRIPVHIELEELLQMRSSYVQDRYNGDIGALPVCCMENQFGIPCKDYQVANKAEELFTRLNASDLLCGCQIDALLEQLDDGMLHEEGQHLTLYALRRNFWTWMASQTQLSDFDKRYVMGHEMDVDGKSVRPQYNDENRLYALGQKMDRCILNKTLHEPSIVLPLQPDKITVIKNRGIFRVNITEKMLQSGKKLHLHLTTEEPGEAVYLTALSANRQLGVGYEVKMMPAPVSENTAVGINTEYENWTAHKRIREHPVKLP